MKKIFCFAFLCVSTASFVYIKAEVFEGTPMRECETCTPVIPEDSLPEDIDIDDLLCGEGENPFQIVNNVTYLPWIKTYSPRGRDVLHKPWPPSLLAHPGFDLQFFYDKGGRLDRPFRDIIGFEFVDLALKIVKQHLDLDVDDALSGFEKITLQERKVGFLASWEWKNPLIIRVDVPLLLSERNIFVSEKYQTLLEALFEKIPEMEGGFLGVSAQEVRKRLEHVELKGGWGDIRLTLSTPSIDLNSFHLTAGASCIIPASDLLHPRREIKVYKDIIGQVELLTSIILKTSTGNLGHWGLGPVLEAKFDITKNLSCYFSGKLDYLFPANENVGIARSRNLPKEYKVKVTPGFITHLIAGILYNTNTWGCKLGYDFYRQQEESWGTVSRGKKLLDVHMKAFKPECSKRPSSTQHSIFGSMDFKCGTIKSNDIRLGFNGQYVVSHRKMGRGWTLGGNCSILF